MNKSAPRHATGLTMGFVMRTRAGAGFSLLELVVVLLVISVLAAFFLDRALTSLESAERMAMENQARAISSALQLQMAALITSRREQEIPKLARANPVSWLISKPENYLGEFERAPTGDDALGHWYFDTGRRELVYLVRRGDRFAADQSGRKEVRYHVREVYSEGTSVRHSFAGLVFAPVSSYRWP